MVACSSYAPREEARTGATIRLRTEVLRTRYDASGAAFARTDSLTLAPQLCRIVPPLPPGARAASTSYDAHEAWEAESKSAARHCTVMLGDGVPGQIC